MRRLLDGLRPNRRVGLGIHLAYVAAAVTAGIVAWYASPAVVPRPGEIWSALGELWSERGLFHELLASLSLNAQAIAWSTAIALGLAYSTVVPAMRPIVGGLSKLRFSGMVGWGFVFAVVADGGRQLQLWMLVFGMTPFFVTSMATVVAEIPRERYDHARTLYASEWRVVWEVVIVGTLDRALESLRQNAAMGWMMLTMVEGIARAEGGVGVLMLDENKHLRLDAVFALIAVVLVVGVAQDAALAWIRRLACPHADLAKER